MCNRCAATVTGSVKADGSPSYLTFEQEQAATEHSLTADVLAANTDNEPNDDFTTATGIDVPGQIDGAIDRIDDEDVYFFTATESGEITIDLTGLSDDIDLVVFDGTGEIELGRSEEFDTTDEQIVINVVSGESYFILVDGFSTAQSSYQLTVSLEPLPESADTEPNNSFNRASQVDVGNDFSGSIADGTDVDYFQFVADATGELSLQMSGLTDDLDIVLFDSNQNTISSSANPGTSGEAILASVEEGETYFIQVEGFFGATSEYAISTGITVLDFDDVTQIDSTGTTKGTVISEDNADIYRFTADSDGPLSVGLFGFSISSDISVNMDLQIYDAQQNLIAVSENFFATGELITFNTVAGEDYFVRVIASVDPASDYVLRLIEGERQTSSDADFSVQENNVPLTEDTAPLFIGRQWEPNQTLGYDLSQLNDAEQIEALTNVFNSLSTTISLDFVPDPLGAFQIIEDDNLDPGVLGIAYLVSAPFNEQFLLSNASAATAIHELGHALGMAHPVEDGNGDPALHGLPFTVMNAFDGTIATDENAGYAALETTGFLVLDLEYLVDLYGEDETNLGNNLYSFTVGEHYFEGLHDGGGTDTLQIIDSDAVGVQLDVNGRGGLDVGVLVGGERDQTVFLTEDTQIEVILTGNGADTIKANRADNLVDAGGGADSVSGGAGDDTLFGEGGRDTLVGGNGDDILEGGNQGDRLLGGGGADLLIGGSGNDVADYLTDREGVFVDLENGVFVGGQAEGDTLEGIEDIRGGRGDDTLAASSAGSELFGIGGDDVLIGSTGEDRLVGGGGADTLVGSAGADRMNGKRGRDLIDYSGSDSGVLVDLNAKAGSGGYAEGDIYRGIEDVIASQFDDTVIGTRSSNVLDGEAGDDIFTGLGGADTFVIGEGEDTITDFSTRQDSLDLSDLDGVDTAAVLASASAQNDGILLTITSSDSVFLAGLTLADVDSINIAGG